MREIFDVDISLDDIRSGCLIFPFSKANANAISALIASLDIHPKLSHLEIKLPKVTDPPEILAGGIEKYSKIILAFSLFSTQLERVKIKIQEYREYFNKKELLVIAGGPHPMGNPFSMLINGADIVCTTEGETVIREIIIRFLTSKNPKKSLGIAYINRNGKVVKTNRPELINLDDYPPFSIKHHLVRPIEITRGCAWNCRFCQIRSRGLPVRHRSIKEVVKYVKITMDYFHQRRPDIRFISPNALSYGSQDGKTLELDQVERLLSQIKQTIGPTGKIYFGSFPSEVRPETITDESVLILKKYTNVEKIVVGGQSGSNKILQKSDRGHSVEETERAVKLLIGHGFQVDVDIIFGLPGEEEEDVEATIKHMKFLANLGATIHSHTFMPLVGTPFASKSAGRIAQNYLPVIKELQVNRKLSGFHVKQEKEAQKLALRKIQEKSMKNQFD